ncbi:MAG: hypothetical protein AABZ30_11200 [Myxococcota bacterium]
MSRIVLFIAVSFSASCIRGGAGGAPDGGDAGSAFGSCGDAICAEGETCDSCSEDCCPRADGSLGEGEAESESECEDEPDGCPAECGDGICDVEAGECDYCGLDCVYECIECGDGFCAKDEGCSLCPEDCGDCTGGCECGDGSCAEWDCGEDCYGCPDDCGDCPVCGNGDCEESYPGYEDCSYCPEDCGDCCGDGYCDVWSGVESCTDCEEDCGVCQFSDGCTVSEDPTCAECACEETVCDASSTSYCCDYYWDEACVLACFDAGGCSDSCGDGVCTGDEEACACPDDCSGYCPACPDGVCAFTYGESCTTCPDDCGTCGTCGDAVCRTSAGENCLWCGDCAPCGVCGDGLCNASADEECTGCPEDCGECVCAASTGCVEGAAYLCDCCYGDPTCFGDLCYYAEIYDEYGEECASWLTFDCDELAGMYCYFE